MWFLGCPMVATRVRRYSSRMCPPGDEETRTPGHRITAFLGSMLSESGRFLMPELFPTDYWDPRLTSKCATTRDTLPACRPDGITEAADVRAFVN
jgi:hypothetical protein